MLARPFVIVVPAAFLAACGGGTNDGAHSRAPAPRPAAGVYAGLFPCDNCPGIETTLWLRPDGTFFWRQKYLDAGGEAASAAFNLGRWQLDPDGTLVLHGSGPARRFGLEDGDELLMLTPSALPHRLSRASGAPAFDDRIRIEGTAVVDDGRITLSECVTGLAASADGAGARQFLRQYRSLGFRGKPAFVEIEARFEWADDGAPRSISIDRFITIKPNRTC